MWIQRKKAEAGSVIVEAVFALPLVFALFFGLFYFGEMLNRHSLLQQFTYASAVVAADNTDDVAIRRISIYRDQFIRLDPRAMGLDTYFDANENVQQPPNDEEAIGNLAFTAQEPQFESGARLVRVNSRSIFNRTFGGCGEGTNDPYCNYAPIMQNGYAAPSLINRGAAVIDNLNAFEENPGAGFPPVTKLYDCHGGKTGGQLYGEDGAVSCGELMARDDGDFELHGDPDERERGSPLIKR